MDDIKLTSLSINGYKSIVSFEDFHPGQINVLVGPNGAGKSNVISFFTFLSWMLNSDGKLAQRVSYLGGANDILFDGSDKTKEISCHLCISSLRGKNEYAFTLMFAKPDNLVFKEEKYRFTDKEKDTEAKWSFCGTGHSEAKLPMIQNPTSLVILNMLRKLIVYQFHNTSDTAALRLNWAVDDRFRLKQHGENLASFLFNIFNTDNKYYYRILGYIRSVLPFFDDFVFYEQYNKILLRWKEKGTQKEFNAGQASDGMLRTIALISLLAQNPANFPAVLFLDEPELGLHPAAVDLVASLIHSAAEKCQIFVATQSVNFLNNFDIEDIVVVERKNRETNIIRPDAETLKGYLNEFSVGEIWEKNIFGGRP